MLSRQSQLGRVCFPNVRLLSVAILLCLSAPVSGLAQFQFAPGFSLSPGVIIQGACYTIRVSNWPGAVLNVGYTTAWAGQQEIYGWPSLDFNGNAFICTNSSTHLGTYIFNRASNNYYYQWWPVNASVTVNAYVPPQQPTSLGFSPTSGYAGLDCYSMIAGNAGYMTVDLNYTFNSVSQSVWSAAMDAGGQWQYCINHHDQVGNYVFYQMKNHAASEWVSVSPPASYLVKAPQPSGLLTSPKSIVLGSLYQMSAGNGAAVTLDVQYSLNDGPVQTITGWPTLMPSDGNYGYNGSSSGYVNIWTGSDTPLGRYVFTAVRNTQNTAWVPATASLVVCPNVPPTIASIVPNVVPQGSSGDITITGSNLCDAVLQTATISGLWFTNVTWNPPFTTVTATVNAANFTPTGYGQIRVSTPAGNVTAQFAVAPPAVLAKEYIYLGDRVLSTVSP